MQYIHTQWDFIQPRGKNEIIDAAGDHYSTRKKTGFLTFPFILPGWLQNTVFITFTDLKPSFISTQPLFLLCSWNIFSLLGEEDLAFYTVILGHIRRCQDCIFFISVSWVFRIAPGPHQLPSKGLKTVWGTGHYIKTWEPGVWALGARDAYSHPLPPVCVALAVCALSLPALAGCAVLLQRGHNFALSRLFVLVSFSWTICLSSLSSHWIRALRWQTQVAQIQPPSLLPPHADVPLEGSGREADGKLNR